MGAKKITFKYRQFFFSFFLLLCGQLFWTINLVAQQSTVDSLYEVLAGAKEDSTQLELINTIATLIYKSNPDSASLILQQILPKAEAKKPTSLLLKLYHRLGLVYNTQERYDSCLLYTSPSPRDS